jgi:hypothetical protein
MTSKTSLTLRLHQCWANNCSGTVDSQKWVTSFSRTADDNKLIQSCCFLALRTKNIRHTIMYDVSFSLLMRMQKWEQRCGHHVLIILQWKKTDDHQILEPSSTTFILTASFFDIIKSSFNPTDLNTTENHITCLLSLKWFCWQPPAVLVVDMFLVYYFRKKEIFEWWSLIH